MRVFVLDDRVTASSQPETAADWDRIRDGAHRLVVNNRRNGEDAAQPTDAAEADEAAARGMGYLRIPVTPGAIGEDEVRRFEAALADGATVGTGGKVLAHCKSGMRSAALWAIAAVRAGRLDIGALDETENRLGIDLAAARAFLARPSGT